MNNLCFLYEKLVQARGPEDIYYPLAGDTDNEQLDALRKFYHYLVKFVHPDKYPDVKEKYMANEATKLLTLLFKEGERKVKVGTFGKIDASASAQKVLYNFEIKGRKYEIFSELGTCDVGHLFVGECTYPDGKKEKVIVKVPEDASHNDLMKNEARVLKKVSHKSSTVLLESCQLKPDMLTVNVFKSADNMYSFEEIKKKYPDGLPQVHIAWILDRLLSVLGFFHINKIIHGGIAPWNILVVPSCHNALLSDFTLSIIDANEPDKKYSGKNQYGAPEITGSSVPNPVTDMYSVGKSIVFLAGGSVDTKVIVPDSLNKEFKVLLERMTCENPSRRSYDAWGEWHKLKELRKKYSELNGGFIELKV